MSWRQSALDGGGFLSTIAVDPSGSGFVVAGGDVAGLHLSENLGQRWQARNLGRSDTKQLKVANIKWSQTVTGQVYACLGAQGVGGGLYISNDYGRYWNLQSSQPQWSGGNTGLEARGHPRSTGNLLELDEANGYLYAGTFKDGLKRSVDGGSNWTNIGLNSGTDYIRGIALDPSDLTTLYAVTSQATSPSIYKVTGIRGESYVVTLLTNSPTGIEEIIVLNEIIYVAGTGGIYSKTIASGDISWTQLDTTANQGYITGYVESGSTILYTGCYDSKQQSPAIGASYLNLRKSTNGGASWTSLTTDPTKIHYNTIGRNNNWWLSVDNPYGMLGGKRYVVSDISINPNDRNQIFVAGRSGAWRSDNGGVDWYPCVKELGLTINYDVKADPNDKNYVYVANSDWVAMRSSDRLQTFSSQKVGNANNAFSYAFDRSTTPSRAYVAVGDASTANSGGGIHSRLPSGTKWINEQFTQAGASTPGVVDNFSRTVASGWGSADTGGAYTTNGGGASEYNVSASAGSIGPMTSGANRTANLAATSMSDLNGTVVFNWDVAAVGGDHEMRVLVRASASLDAYYSFGVRHRSSNDSVNIIMRRLSGGVLTTLQNLDIYTGYTLGSNMILQFDVSGTTLACKAWLETDEPPDDWQLSQTDATIAGPGSVGILCTRQGTSTATPTFSFISMSVSLPAPGGVNGAWPIGMAFGTDASSNKVVVVAAQLSGIWRKTVPLPGGGTWSLVNTTAMQNAQTTKYTSISWAPGSAYVWLFDRASGVWRSSDYGLTWTQVWAITSNVDYTGYIAADPSIPSVLWVSRNSGLYKLTGADTGSSVGSGITATQITAVGNNPGAICVKSSNDIYVVTRAISGTPLTVLKSTDGGTNWLDISSDTLKNTMNFVHNIDVDSDGRIYLAANGTGVDYYLPVDPQIQHIV